MVSLHIHGMVKSFGRLTNGLQHKSTIDVNRLAINAHQFNNQLDHRSITKWTNVRAEIWTRILHNWKRVLYQLSYQSLYMSCLYFTILTTLMWRVFIDLLWSVEVLIYNTVYFVVLFFIFLLSCVNKREDMIGRKRWGVS
jgi:hypothetical protein